MSEIKPLLFAIFWKRKFSPTCRQMEEHWGKFNVCPVLAELVQENGAEFVKLIMRKQEEAGLEKNKLLRANILMITAEILSNVG